MKNEIKQIYWLLILILSFSLLGYAQVKMKGEISGVVVDEKGETLPGVTISLSGEKLFQKSLSAVSTERGLFKFLGLNPGIYVLEFTLQGFDRLKIDNVEISVGKTTPIRAVLTAAKLAEKITVVGKAPLIETKTTQLATNFSAMTLEKIPTSRNLLDLAEAVPAINDRGAYGAGGFSDYGYLKGSPTSNFQINGVDIADMNWGQLWVNPAYETIDEIQVTGIGASAEYGNFTGASINVVTKSGSNTFHGGLSLYYTNSGLYGDNSGGVIDLTPGHVKYRSESVAYIGGPIIKEKVFFFASLGYTANKAKGFRWAYYGTQKQPHYQLRFDWAVTKKTTLSLMANTDPMDHENLGLEAGSGPEIGYTNRLRATTIYGSLQSILSESTIFEAKYARFNGETIVDPASPDAIAVHDYSKNRTYGSSGVKKDSFSDRDQVNAALTQYADNLLGASHEFKFGLEFERSSYTNNVDATGKGGIFYIYPMAGGFLINGNTGYYSHWKANITRIGVFAQDNIKIGSKISVNLGLRYDNPKLTGRGASGTVVGFSNLAPRIGVSYDFGGDAKNVIHLHYGRYYDKLIAYNFSRTLPWGGPVLYYYLSTTEPFVPTPENIAKLPSLVNRPENLSFSYSSAPMKVEIDKWSHTDVFNIGFEKLLFENFALSIDYVRKWDRNFPIIETHTVHTYEEHLWTDPILGKTVPVWYQLDRAPDDRYITTSSWAKRNHDFLIVTLRKREMGKWSMMVSYTYQHSRGNISNSTGEAMGTANTFGDSDPNYSKNPLRWGEPWLSRPHQFKLITSYSLPWGFIISGNLRLLSGNSITPAYYSGYAGLYFNRGFDILLEKRGSRREPSKKMLDIRLAKSFRLGGFSNLELDFEILNAFNSQDCSYYYFRPTDVYPLSQTSSFLKPAPEMGWGGIGAPRRAQLGVRWIF